MNWRWTWARAQVTAMVTSAVVWLVTAALAPAAVATALLVGVFLVALWRKGPMLWWRYGARAMAPADAEAVWRALVPVEWLRGRNQPRLRIGTRLVSDVVAAGPRDLLLSERLLRQFTQHQVSDADLRRLVVRALALGEGNQSRLVATVEMFCLPWSLLVLTARTVCRPAASMRLVGVAWRLRWLVLGLAVFDLYGRGQWLALLMLVMAAAATVTTPRWNRTWTRRQAGMADAAEERLTPRPSGLTQHPDLGSPGNGHAPRPSSGRGGAL